MKNFLIKKKNSVGQWIPVGEISAESHKRAVEKRLGVERDMVGHIGHEGCEDYMVTDLDPSVKLNSMRFFVNKVADPYNNY